MPSPWAFALLVRRAAGDAEKERLIARFLIALWSERKRVPRARISLRCRLGLHGRPSFLSFPGADEQRRQLERRGSVSTFEWCARCRPDLAERGRAL